MADGNLESSSKCEENCFNCTYVKHTIVPQLIKNHIFSLVEWSSSDKIHHVNVQHIPECETDYSDAIRTMIYKAGREQPAVQVIIKLLKVEDPDALPSIPDLYMNEMTFYASYGKMYNFIVPHIYLANPKCLHTNLPFVVLSDPTANGFEQLGDTLDLRSIKSYVTALAKMHGESLKMEFHDRRSSCDLFVRYLSGPMAQEERSVLKETFRSLMLDIESQTSIGLYLKEKMKTKFMDVDNFMSSGILTVIHNSFRHNIFLKAESDNVDSVRVIDFRRIQIGPPVIDFGYVLLSNLNATNEHSHQLPQCYDDIISCYLNALGVNDKNRTVMREHIIKNLPYVYVTMLTQGEAMGRKIRMLRVFNRLGCFV